MAFRNLPPLASLRAFEAATRRSSFKAAAEELSVTPTAISHQIRQLETWLGLRVLNRSPRSVSLTVEGAVLYEATGSGFAQIQKAVSRLRHGSLPATLTLSSTTGFLSHWMARRMGDFYRLHPEIDLRLHASDELVELRSGGIEAALRYGRGLYDGAVSIAICKDSFAPVCSPQLGLFELDDLRQTTLIHIDGRRAPGPDPDWARWCNKAGMLDIDTRQGLRFSDSLLALQAAIAGQGIAIVSLVLAADALSAGLLQQPFSQTLEGDSYHFVCAEEVATRADIDSLRKWFLSTLGPPH